MTESGPAQRVILVTGGAQGLGAAAARQMAARGWTVAVADVNEAGAHDGIEVAAGVNRCMVETSPGAPDSCVRCGECLAGCFRDAIFSSRRTMAEEPLQKVL